MTNSNNMKRVGPMLLILALIVFNTNITPVAGKFSEDFSDVTLSNWIFIGNDFVTKDVNYLTVAPATANGKPLAPKPVSPASSVNFSWITETAMTVSWTGGSGSNRLRCRLRYNR